jgi:hypothetical protein
MRPGWDFVSTGHGDVPWEDCFRALNAIGYDGPISIEWEDAGMDRLVGAAEAVQLVRRLGVRPARGRVRRRVRQQGLTRKRRSSNSRSVRTDCAASWAWHPRMKP